jgi:nicotinamide-nucleotide amidase
MQRMEPQAAPVITAAIAANVQIATAESLTAGLIAATLAEVSGASAVLRGGVISYSSEVKASLLGVDESLLAQAGSVDGEVARQMAVGAQHACGAQLAVSATGVAGPQPHDGKAVGTVFIGWAYREESGFVAHHFVGDRAKIRERSTIAAINQLASILSKASSQ